jgi:hypothetical protein
MIESMIVTPMRQAGEQVFLKQKSTKKADENYFTAYTIEQAHT